ncbi:MAG: hypothetical protein ACJ76K_16970 [Solirubrobacteraceae bacterium]
MSRLIRPPVVLGLIGALAAVLAACGGSSDDPNKLLKETFSGNHKVTSGRLNVAIDISAKGVQNLSQPVKIALTGPFQSEGQNQLPKFDLNLSFSGGGQTFSAGAVSTADAGYLKFQGQAYKVPPNVFDQFKQGFEQAQNKRQGQTSDNALERLGLDPLKWVKDAKVEDDEDIGGTSTKHISASIDVPKFTDDLNVLLKNAQSLSGGNTGRLPSNLTQQQRQQIIDAVKTAKFQVWTGAEDKTLRKLQVDLGISGSGGRSGNLTFTVEIDDLNQGQTINAPANAKSFSDLTNQLGQLGLGGALGGAGATGGTGSSGSSGSGSSGSGSSGSAASNAKLQKYSECLQQAGGDAAKAQKCADLLK